MDCESMDVIKDAEGNILTGRRGGTYFEELLNMKNPREGLEQG